MRKTLPALAVTLVLIAAIGLVSGYAIPDFTDANWETVLFLTPSGIVQNHVQWSILRDFYDSVSPGQIALSPSKAAVLAVLWLGLVANLFFLARKWRRPA